MPTWKPHALAVPHSDQLELRAGDRVVSTIDLPAVPSGTAGKILLANGFNWHRYRVLFTNGEEIGDLDGRDRNVAPPSIPGYSVRRPPRVGSFRCPRGYADGRYRDRSGFGVDGQWLDRRARRRLRCCA